MIKKKLVYYIKSIALKVVSWIIVGIGLLLIIQLIAFIRMGEFLYAIIYGGVLIVPVILLSVISKIKERKREEERKNHKEYLRRIGDEVKVDLEKCKIIESKNIIHYDRQDLSPFGILSTDNRIGSTNLTWSEQRINAIDAQLNPEFMNERMHKEQCWCVITATITYKGKKQSISSKPISIDNITLGIYLGIQKETSVYINPKNRKEYYFDLDFLSRESV
ncbi:hypothetical protein [Bacteroides cellulosilyticus]|uniref:hypothetical protein n=1 Tax=Bacteroides cellulosilyticus TaxID=246787 RepID=UPI0032ED9F78